VTAPDTGRVARTLAEIAHTLESAERAGDRLAHALGLVCRLVPARSCALLRRGRDGTELFIVPAQDAAARERVGASLEVVLSALERDERELPRNGDVRVTLPLLGLDRVIGAFGIEPLARGLDAEDLRLAAVVAAQLGSYLAILSLREEELRRSEELRAALEAQQLFVGIVSHDLRSPLSVIAMGAEAIVRHTGDALERRVGARVLSTARRAERILHDLLDVTQARMGGGLTITRRLTDLRRALQESIGDLRFGHPDRRIDLELPAGAEVVGEYDADRLQQALTNLVDNALKHGAPGAPVRVRLSLHEDRVEVAVHNHGAPIPAELVPVLFNPFRRARDERVQGGGLGLGLYIVSQIARAHGGAIDVRSTAIEGTTFRLILPRSYPDPGLSRPGNEPNCSTAR
jgi:signal transduction histidine kinase